MKKKKFEIMDIIALNDEIFLGCKKYSILRGSLISGEMFSLSWNCEDEEWTIFSGFIDAKDGKMIIPLNSILYILKNRNVFRDME